MSSSRVRLLVLAACGVLLSANLGHATCDPSTDPDKSDIANARAAVAANCDCAGAINHGDYVTCAAKKAKAALTNKRCTGLVKKCASHSICGKPMGLVTCWRTTIKGTTCRIRKNAAHCSAAHGTVGAARAAAMRVPRRAGV